MKNAIAIILTLIILVACTLLPPVISRSADEKLLGNAVTDENVFAVSGYSYQLSLEQRLELFIGSKTSATILSQYNEITDYGEIAASLKLLEPEIAALRDQYVFPVMSELNFSGSSSYLGIITCSDLYDPYMSMVYREMTTSSLSRSLQCFFQQDVLSGKIIEFWVTGYMPAADLDYVFDAIEGNSIAVNWAEYLGLSDYVLETVPGGDNAYYYAEISTSSVSYSIYAFWDAIYNTQGETYFYLIITTDSLKEGYVMDATSVKRSA